MATIKPFMAIRPNKEKAAKIAALPYDVFNRAEAKQEVMKESLSFLRIDRPETQFADDMDMYADEVYQKAHDILWEMVANGEFVTEEKECYYIYELTMNGRVQDGLVACASIDDYVEITRLSQQIREIRNRTRSHVAAVVTFCSNGISFCVALQSVVRSRCKSIELRFCACVRQISDKNSGIKIFVIFIRVAQRIDLVEHFCNSLALCISGRRDMGIGCNQESRHGNKYNPVVGGLVRFRPKQLYTV